MHLNQTINTLLLINIFISCQQEKNETIKQRDSFVILADSAQDDRHMLYSNIEGKAHYPAYYVGEKTDTIRLGDPISIYYDEVRDAKYDTARSWAKVNDDNLTIFVDTTIHLNYYGNDEGIDSITACKLKRENC